ncbi:hypothetical protein EVAR_50942_1 [Eumeta japonica]|uniref:Uncharacterized protein n=1 Tax=Eumeta variegata TaxID=151549 RepID=A0A4C1X9T9_EUMVA|nr:hypothetical protein EVAR_50942_1 [Eumeta japonica]
MIRGYLRDQEVVVSLPSLRTDPLETASSRHKRELAWLHEVKHGKGLGDTFLDQELEKPVYFGDLPYPAQVPEFGYESVEDLDSQTLDCLTVVGQHIYTDRNRIGGKVGAALTK